MSKRQLSLLLVSVLLAGTAGPSIAQDDPEHTNFSGAHSLTCERVDNGKIILDRERVFYLARARTDLTEEYQYRDGRAGARKMNFRINRDIVTCTAKPVEGEAASPVTEFDGVYQLACSEFGRELIRPVYVENLVERGTDKSIVYEYDIVDGPPRRQTVMLSVTGSDCMVRYVRGGDAAPDNEG